MLRRNQRASEIAKYLVDDGDNLRITTSCVENEENSSIVGNASMAMSVVYERLKSSEAKETKSHEEDLATDSSSDLSDDGSYSRQPKGEVPRYPGLKNATTFENVFGTKAIKKGLSNAEKLLATRGVKSFLLKRTPLQTSFLSSPKYQEMEESGDMARSPTLYEASSNKKSQRSVRSARLDVATGRPMLARQNAQVMGRPSAAHHEWEIGTVLSPSQSLSTRKSPSRRSGKSIAWDDGSHSVQSEISHLTGDSFRSKRSGYSESRAMYIEPDGGNLLMASEDDDETNSASDDGDIPNKAFFEKFRQERILRYSQSAASPLNQRDTRVVDDFVLSADDDFSQVSELNLRGANSDDGLFSTKTGIQTVRQRVMSDSQFLFEMLRRKRLISTEQGLNHGPHEKEDAVWAPRTPTYLVRSASFSDYLFPPLVDDFDQAQRPRCFSENNIEYFDSDEDGAGMQYLEHVEFDKEVTSSSTQRNFAAAPAEFHRLLKDSASKLPALVLPTFGRGIPLRGVAKAADSIPLLSDHDSSPVSMQPPRRLSDSCCEEGNPPVAGGSDDAFLRRPRQRTNSAASGAAVKESFIRQAVEPMRAPLQAISRATTAAKIMASSLLPPAAVSLPSKTSKAYDYYWKKDDEDSEGDNEVLWSLSKDDSFGDMF
jgi:hypothetical protein